MAVTHQIFFFFNPFFSCVSCNGNKIYLYIKDIFPPKFLLRGSGGGCIDASTDTKLRYLLFITSINKDAKFRINLSKNNLHNASPYILKSVRVSVSVCVSVCLSVSCLKDF